MEDESETKGPRRKRVSRACDRCRSKKDRCDGIRPTCSACQISGQICSYDPHAKKRGLPEGYVRGLEKLWALSICNIDGLEDIMLTLLGSTTASAGRRRKLMKLWSDESASESLHGVWKTSRLWGALEKMLSNSDPDGDSRQSPVKRPREDEDSSSPDPSSTWGYRVGRGTTPTGIEVPRIVAPPSPDTKRAKLSSATDSNLSPPCVTNSLSLPPQTPQLLEIYFSRTHPWFPIIAKHNIQRASYLYSPGPITIGKLSPSSGDHAALWAILSYTIAQLAISPQNGQASHDKMVSPGLKAEELYSVSRSLIPSEKELFEIGHIQALLLLCLVNIGLEDWNAAWLQSGQAVRMAAAVEPGRSSDVGHAGESRQHKAVLLGCFVIDSILSARLSRPACMSAEHLSRVGRLEEDGSEEWTPWMEIFSSSLAPRVNNPPNHGPLLALSCFNRLVDLVATLNKVTRDVSNSEDILAELRQWDGCLPLGCRLMGTEVYPERRSSLLPHQTYLTLTYIATLLRLYPGLPYRDRMSLGSYRSLETLLHHTVLVLSQYAENFRMCGLPPIFEFSLRSIYDAASTIQTEPGLSAFPFSKWIGTFRQRLTDIGSRWPVLGSLISFMGHGPLGEPLLPSQGPQIGTSVGPSLLGTTYTPMPKDVKSVLPADLVGKNQNQDTINAQCSPTGSTNHMKSEYSSKDCAFNMPLNGIYIPSHNSAPEDLQDLSAITASGSAQSTGLSAVLLDKFLSNKAPSGTKASVCPPLPLASQPSIANTMMQQTNPGLAEGSTNSDKNVRYSSSNMYISDHSSSPGDLDSIFKDIVYLDTNEWALNREETLRDFGFIDDNTFHAFCNDPERLAGSQPLIHPPSIADIWPPPGFFPETFQHSADAAADI